MTNEMAKDLRGFLLAFETGLGRGGRVTVRVGNGRGCVPLIREWEVVGSLVGRMVGEPWVRAERRLSVIVFKERVWASVCVSVAVSGVR